MRCRACGRFACVLPPKAERGDINKGAHRQLDLQSFSNTHTHTLRGADSALTSWSIQSFLSITHTQQLTCLCYTVRCQEAKVVLTRRWSMPAPSAPTHRGSAISLLKDYLRLLISEVIDGLARRRHFLLENSCWHQQNRCFGMIITTCFVRGMSRSCQRFGGSGTFVRCSVPVTDLHFMTNTRHFT